MTRSAEAAAAGGRTPILTASKLCKTFSHSGVQQHVLKNIDLDIYKGDFTVIMGPSGSGKSTLLYALSGIDKPTLGSIAFGGREITDQSFDQLARFRRTNCGFVFQQIYLLDNMSILDNVVAAGRLASRNRKAVVARAQELLRDLNLDETTWHKFPSQTSGGEAQRAGIARALINTPLVVFADEPTGQLNSANGQAVLDALTRVNEQGQSVVMVTHDLTSARRGNRVLYLRDGHIRGECALGRYGSDGDQRGAILAAFLSDMGW